MPDHAKKLGELTEMMKFEASALDDKFGHEVMASLRYKQAAAILDALGPVVSQLVNSNGLIYAVERDDAEALLTAVENLR